MVVGQGAPPVNQRQKTMATTSSLFERAVDRAGSFLFVGLSLATALAVAAIAG